MPGNDWTAVQHRLVTLGLLDAGDVVREVHGDADITTELNAALHRLPGAVGAVGDRRFRFNDVIDIVNLIAAREPRFCGVRDEPDGHGGIAPLKYGLGPGGEADDADVRRREQYYRTGTVTFSINASKARVVAGGVHSKAGDIHDKIRQGFMAWAPFTRLRLVEVAVGTPADVHAKFGIEDDLGTPGGVLAHALFSTGNLMFDSVELWTLDKLRRVAVHEFGHALGLGHSDIRNGTMFPYQEPAGVIDDEAGEAIRILYGWAPQRNVPVAAGDRPSLSVEMSLTFQDRFETPVMVWKNASDYQIFASSLVDGQWTPAQPIPDVRSTHSPAAAPIGIPGPPPEATGTFLAWRGEGNDHNLYYTRRQRGGWLSHHRIDGVGSSDRPAATTFEHGTFCAWKGVPNDSQLWWSRYDGDRAFSPQKPLMAAGSSHGPALVGWGNRMYLFWKGAVGDRRLWWAWMDFTAQDANFRPQVLGRFAKYKADEDHVNIDSIWSEIRTDGSPAACVTRDGILVTWPEKATIRYAFFDGSTFTMPGVMPAAAAEHGTGQVEVAPKHDGLEQRSTVIAWKGPAGDPNIWWSRI